jgi:hypothetical protein
VRREAFAKPVYDRQRVLFRFGFIGKDVIHHAITNALDMLVSGV